MSPREAATAIAAPTAACILGNLSYINLNETFIPYPPAGSQLVNELFHAVKRAHFRIQTFIEFI